MAGNNKRVKINSDAKDFAKATFKRYKKDCSSYESKKEMREGFNLYLIDLLPEAIYFVVNYGFIRQDEVQEVKNAIYEKFVSDEYLGFVKQLKKEIKNGNKIRNIKLLPIAIRNILKEADKANKELLAQDPSAKIYDMSNLVELSEMILKKKLKKMEKDGIDVNMAFDILSIIPDESCLKVSQNYRIYGMMDVLYEHSRTKTIPFEAIIENLVDKEWYLVFCAFSLLERKEKFGQLTDSQKQFYLSVTTWTFKTMESLSKDEIQNIIQVYINGRKRDDSNGKDSNRRYALMTLPEADYPKIKKVLNRMVANDESIKKYL